MSWSGPPQKQCSSQVSQQKGNQLQGTTRTCACMKEEHKNMDVPLNEAWTWSDMVKWGNVNVSWWVLTPPRTLILRPFDNTSKNVHWAPLRSNTTESLKQEPSLSLGKCKGTQCESHCSRPMRKDQVAVSTSNITTLLARRPLRLTGGWRSLGVPHPPLADRRRKTAAAASYSNKWSTQSTPSGFIFTANRQQLSSSQIGLLQGILAVPHPERTGHTTVFWSSDSSASSSCSHSPQCKGLPKYGDRCARTTSSDSKDNEVLLFWTIQCNSSCRGQKGFSTWHALICQTNANPSTPHKLRLALACGVCSRFSFQLLKHSKMEEPPLRWRSSLEGPNTSVPKPCTLYYITSSLFVNTKTY